MGKSLGDTPIDISTAPSGPVKTTYTVHNGAANIKMCGQFTGAGCSHKSIAGGTGFKLVCKGNGLGAACPASPSGAFVD